MKRRIGFLIEYVSKTFPLMDSIKLQKECACSSRCRELVSVDAFWPGIAQLAALHPRRGDLIGVERFRYREEREVRHG